MFDTISKFRYELLMHTSQITSRVRPALRPALGNLLKQWRERRGLSQLDLGLKSDVSSRHLSFVESGRSQPTREMVLRLAEALQIPLREQNLLLEAAGFAQLYRETGLSDPEMKQTKKAIDLILKWQEPFPAVVMDRHWNILHANKGAQRFFAKLLGKTKAQGPANVVRMVFHPDALRPWIENWTEVAASLILRVHREAVGGLLDEQSEALLREVLQYPGVPGNLQAMVRDMPSGPLIPVQFRKRGLALSFFSTVTTLGTPRDISLQELRIECFFPADAQTERTAKVVY
jgi:transcriptional regulator with XRE-family HTH domain